MRRLNPEIVVGFLVASLFWIGVLIWSSSKYSEITPQQKTAAEASETKSVNSHQAKSLWAPEDATGFFTLWIAAFTGVLALSTIGLWIATHRTAKIAGHALTDLERPYIYIFNPSGLKADRNQEDPLYYFEYSVANYGKTPAHVESAAVRVSVGKEPKYPHLGMSWHEFLASPLFVSGERRDNLDAVIPAKIEIIETADEHGQYETPVLTGDHALFLWVIVRYSGPFSGGHETSACWKWGSDGYRLVLHTEHNHQK